MININTIIEEIEKSLELRIPEELKSLYSFFSIEGIDNVLMDMKGFSKHWFLDYVYQLINISDINKLTTFYEHNKEINKYQSNWGWEDKKNIVFAETNEIVDGGGFLFYAFDSNDDNIGIYATAYGWIDEVVFVAKSLSDLFEFNKDYFNNAIKDRDEKHSIELKKKDNLLCMNFRDILKKETYVHLDAEIGGRNLQAYINIIDNVFIPLSNGKLIYTNLKEISSDTLEWCLDNKSWKIKLDISSDYLDEHIFISINQILVDNDIYNKFIPFKENGQGQDFILAFLNKEEEIMLQNVYNLDFF